MPEKLGRLTKGEKLLVARRRSGETQRVAAEKHDVGLSLYRKWEQDLEEPPNVTLGTTEPHERCFLYRRRAGQTLPVTAADFGCCRYWLNQMELGHQDCTELLKYWEG